MPIYAYRCAACGHARDVLQKMSDPLLSTCPACGAEAFTKQVTAAGFQLKGSGWYATDFKSSGAAPAATTPPEGQDKPAGADKSDAADKSGDKPADKSGDKAGDKSSATPAAAAGATPPASKAPAAGGGAAPAASAP